MKDVNKKLTDKQKRICEYAIQCRAENLSVDELLCLQLSGYSSRQIMQAGIEETARLSITTLKAARELDKAKRILDRQAKAGVVTIPFHDKDYPCCFRNLGADAPPLIHVLGNAELLNRNDSVAVIGARAADNYGLDAAYGLSRQVAEQGHIVISGLALGCDTAVHRGCLDVDGQTVAVVASGLDITHPKLNKSLQDEIVAKGGAVVSEHPFGVKANPTRLVARCRLQVALTQSVIVAQCPVISGTMYAVRFAQEYSGGNSGLRRQIYAVEYDTMNELNSGNKFLLDYHLALPIKAGQRIELDEYGCLVVN